ncbi:MAG: NAD-dependent protein deacylase [Bacteroidales bacterium]|nr:NAD-dependent protein deacylase [Bacteroidales bacterium]
MKHLVILTGAGISKESGLATFRGKDSMWTNEEWVYLASTDALINDTQRCLDFYNYRRKQLSEVEPNHAHKVLAELEKKYKVSIITQNVDDLHERAGSTNVLHLHGELRKVTGSNIPNDSKCIVEKKLDEPILIGEKAADGSQLRPYVVFFGESVPNMKQAERIAQEADIFVIIGTSLQVYPAAYLKEMVAWMIPCYIIDPGDFYEQDLYGFEHIKTTAVAGIDILKRKLAEL